MMRLCAIARIDLAVDASADDLVRPGRTRRLPVAAAGSARRISRRTTWPDAGAAWTSGARAGAEQHEQRCALSRIASSSSGISISSSAELNDLPCASSASVRVTPPPTTP